MLKPRVILFITSLILFQTSIADTSKVGIVLLIKGEVIMKKADGHESYLKKGAPVFDKSTIETQDQSFIRIVFDDRSSLNLASNSLLQINNYPKNNPGVLSLVRGKIRTLVKKDYLKWRRDKNKNKLFIKTENAALGVRGTDFIVDFDHSKKVTSLDVITGEVAMVNTQEMDYRDIKAIDFDKMLRSRFAVLVKPGMRSTIINRKLPPSRPSMIPKKILNKLQIRKMDFIKRRPSQERDKETLQRKRPNSSKDEGLEQNPLFLLKNKNHKDHQKRTFKRRPIKRMPRPVQPPSIQTSPIKTDTYTAPTDIKR